MKTLLLFLLSLPALAQLPAALSWTDYRLNPAQHTVRLDSAWSAQSATVKIYDAPGGTAYPDFLLPTLTRQGNALFVSFTPIQLARLADKTYITISTGGVVRLAGYLNLGYSTTAPNSSTSVAYSGIISWDLIKSKPLTFPSSLSAVSGLTDALASLSTTIASLSVVASSAVQSGTYTANRTADQNALAVHATNTANPHNTTAAQVGAYTQAQVTSLLQGYYLPVTVATKAAAIAAAVGSQPKIIKVLVDESDGNRRNKYIYDGDNQPLSYPLF